LSLVKFKKRTNIEGIRKDICTKDREGGGGAVKRV